MARQRWASRQFFVLAAIGSAVGLGNIWRFPYLAGKYGGGAFLVPYLLAFILLGVPLLILEIAIGQKMQQGAINSFRKLHPAFGGIGLMAIASCLFVGSYYAVVIAWCLIYLMKSFSTPWAGGAEAYFFQDILQINDHVQLFDRVNLPILLALAAVWIAIYFCIWKGTQSVSKVVFYSVPIPVAILGILLVRAVTLPGFWQGWQLYLTPIWSVLFAPDVWTAACTQIFYTLSVGFGAMLTYGSYKDEREDIVKDAWITALINSGTSLFAGFVVFAVLGHMAWIADTPVSDLATSGPGLAFVVFPEALSLMPLSGLFSALFFLMLVSLGIDSAFSIVEPIIAVVGDRHPQLSTSHVAAWICLMLFGIGVLFTTRSGLYFLDIVDHFVTHYDIALVDIGQALLAGWVVGAESLRRYVNQISDWTVGRWWNISVRWIVPGTLTILLVTQLSIDVKTPYEGYPAWALGIGWTTVVMPILLLGWMVWYRQKREFSAPIHED